MNWGYNTIGVFQNQDQINNWPVNIDGKGNTTLLPGDFIVEDVNGDGRIDSQDERPIAYQDNSSVAPQPIINGGLTLGFDWKGIDLSADFSLAGGYAFTPNWETRWPFQNGRTLVRETQFKNRWRHEDPFDPNSAWIPGDVPALRFTAVNMSPGTAISIIGRPTSWRSASARWKSATRCPGNGSLRPAFRRCAST